MLGRNMETKQNNNKKQQIMNFSLTTNIDIFKML